MNTNGIRTGFEPKITNVGQEGPAEVATERLLFGDPRVSDKEAATQQSCGC